MIMLIRFFWTMSCTKWDLRLSGEVGYFIVLEWSIFRFWLMVVRQVSLGAQGVLGKVIPFSPSCFCQCLKF